ncbi:MAG: FAD-binding oxidoreductase [Chloroflexi bacterium OHK40]
MTSHWHATLDASPLPTVEFPARAEVVVVGAGIHGAAAAYWLARTGAAPLLLDRIGPAAGATGHNGGLCVAGTAEAYLDAVARLGHPVARAVWSLSAAGYDQLAATIAEEEIACDWRPTGNLAFALDPGQLQGFREAATLLAADGFAMELLDRHEVQALVPTPLGPEVIGARRNPRGASLHSARLVHGLLAAAVRHGARLCWGVEVAAVRADGAGLLLQTSLGSLGATTVVLALNAWSADVLPDVRGVITPVRGQALATAPRAPALSCGFGASLTPTGEYGQQTATGAVVFGGCRAVAPSRDVGARTLVPSAEVQAALDAALGRLFPALAGAPVARRWAGLMAFTSDYLPIAGADPTLPGLWYSGGFCGHGMPFAMPFGRLLADAALSGVAPSALAPFRRDRPTLAAEGPAQASRADQ